MLDWTKNPADAIAEVRAAQDYVKSFLHDWDETLRRYHSSGYCRHRGDDGEWLDWHADDPENQGFEMMSLIQPLLTSSNPRVRYYSKRGGASKQLASAMTLGMNRWIVDTDVQKFNTEASAYFLLKYSIGMVTRRPEPGSARGARKMWPALTCIDPRDFVFDFMAPRLADRRWGGHIATVARTSLLNHARANPRDGWNIPMLETPPENSMQPSEGSAEERYSSAHSISRDDIQYYQIHCPYEQMDAFPKSWEKSVADDPRIKNKSKPTTEDGFNGIVYTICVSGNYLGSGTQWLRDPIPYWGPPCGPYAIGGEYVVPGQPLPLNTLSATKSQARHRNANKRAMWEDMNSYKRQVYVAGQSMNGDGEEELVEIVQNGQHMGVFRIPNVTSLDGMIQQVELGGITQQHLAMDQADKENLDRATGILDSQRGHVSGAGTATEHALAGTASQSRTAWKTLMYREFNHELLHKVGWFLAHDNEVTIELGDDAGSFQNQQGAPVQSVAFQGGVEEGEEDEFDSLYFEIEADSMQYSPQGLAQIRMGQIDSLLGFIAQVGPQAPFINWHLYLQNRGDSLNWPELGELVDVDLMRQWGAMLLQMEEAPPEAKGSSGPPRSVLSPYPKMNDPDPRTSRGDRASPGASPGRTMGAYQTQDLGAN